MRRRVWLAAGGLSYLLLYLNRHWMHWPLPTLVTCYLADVLALPLALSAALWLMRHLYFHQPGFTLPAAWVIATWVAWSIWFEGILPTLQPQATADVGDVLAYALGGLIFWRWLNVPATSEQ